MDKLELLVAILLAQVYLASRVDGHGRMLEPPARNTLWRFGFKAPPNYNDNELFCGGIGGIVRNEGKCGICGDPYDGIRIHETGQSMALNQTTRNYFPGSTVDVMIEIVANHGGEFQFEMCWRDEWSTRETEDCFESLKVVSSNSARIKRQAPFHIINEDSRYNEVEGIKNEDNQDESMENESDLFFYELNPNSGTGIHTMSIELPTNKSCENCILRWHWRSANNWGVCEDGSEQIGCGYQEIYRNCADISVKRDGAGIRLGFERRR